MTKETKGTTKQTTKPPTGEKFYTAKDLANMANVEPRVLRRCLRTHFDNHISTTKDENGLKTYHIKASNPIVKEIIAKVKSNGNGNKGKVAAKATVQPVKGKGKAAKAPKSITAKTPAKTQEPVMPAAQAAEAGLPENHDEEGEGEEPSPDSPIRTCFNYQGYVFNLHEDFTATVINPSGSISRHTNLANALNQRGFSFKQLEKLGVLPEELINGTEPSPESDFNTNYSIVLTGTNKPEVVGSNPTPATNETNRGRSYNLPLLLCATRTQSNHNISEKFPIENGS